LGGVGLPVAVVVALLVGEHSCSQFSGGWGWIKADDLPRSDGADLA
jgi:hypothetical protein